MKNNDILIVILDDEEWEAKALAKFLEQNNFPNNKIFTVSLTLLENIDLEARIYIIDYKIDKMNGLEVIEKIRKVVPHAYFIMLSGMKHYAIVEAFNNTVIRGKYVSKDQPDTKERIIKFIKEFIDDMKLMEAYYQKRNEIVNSINEIRNTMKGEK